MADCKILMTSTKCNAREVTFAFFGDSAQILSGNCAVYDHTHGIISYDSYGNITGCRPMINCATN